MGPRGWTLVKWSALGVSLGSIVLSIALAGMAGKRQPPAQASAGGDQPGARQTRVEKPLIVERDGERVVWKLSAGEASQQLDGRMRLTLPVLTLYAEDGRAIPVKSDMAWFQPLKRHIVFEGHVRVRDGRRLLTCGRLIYAGLKNEILVPGAFRASEPGRRARGRNMRIRRASETLDVRGGIVIEIDRAASPRILPEVTG